MTQEDALKALQEIFPINPYLAVSRERTIGYVKGWANTFYLWDHSGSGRNSIIASSNRSWEHAVAIAKSGNEDCWPEDDSPVEKEAAR
jgi:hypothetical protein